MSLKFRLHMLRLLCGCVVAAGCAGVFATGAWAFNTVMLKTPAETLELGVFSAQLVGDGLTQAESGTYTLEAGTHTLTLQALGNAQGVIVLQAETLPVAQAEEAESELTAESSEITLLALTSETAGPEEGSETPTPSEAPAPALVGEYWAMLDAAAPETAEIHFTLESAATLRLHLTMPEALPDDETAELTSGAALVISSEPITEAAPTPTPEPTPDPMATALPAPSATPEPSAEPSAAPTAKPSVEPSVEPSAAPTPSSEPAPSAAPEPSAEPTPEPNAMPEPDA